jgi:hypothetical protein
LLARRLRNEAALDFLRWIQRGALEVDCAEVSTLPNVIAVSERFADLPFDLAGASMAEAAARLQIGAVVSTTPISTCIATTWQDARKPATRSQMKRREAAYRPEASAARR